MECLSTFIRSEKVKVCCVYKVTNTINGKVYIGQTTNFRKRLSDYNNLHKKKDTQPIVRAAKKYGVENFTIEILEECDPESLSERENYYTKKYKSKDKEFGYNYIENNNPKSNSEESRKKKSLSHIGLKESANTKRKKSNIILIVKDNDFFICDSAKLFGDIVGKGKDSVKNYLRYPYVTNNFLVYYADYDKRQEIRHKVEKNFSTKFKDYIYYLDIIDKIELEGVETIYRYFDSLYSIYYDEDGYRISYVSEETLYFSEHEEFDDLLFCYDDEVTFTYDDFNSFYIDPEDDLLCIYD